MPVTSTTQTPKKLAIAGPATLTNLWSFSICEITPGRKCLYWRHCSEISTDVQDCNNKANAVAAITYLLKVFIESTYGLNFLHFIHGDIIETVIAGVKTLHCHGKKNLLYIFSKILSDNKLKLD